MSNTNFQFVVFFFILSFWDAAIVCAWERFLVMIKFLFFDLCIFSVLIFFFNFDQSGEDNCSRYVRNDTTQIVSLRKINLPLTQFVIIEECLEQSIWYCSMLMKYLYGSEGSPFPSISIVKVFRAKFCCSHQVTLC